MPALPYKGVHPRIGSGCFVAPDAWITGDVTIGDGVTILFGVVIRGDIQPISIGEGSNLQEHAVIHTSRGRGPCIIGQGVTVGHHAVLHGCKVSDYTIVGMSSTVLDDANIREHCIIGAHALVPMKMEIPTGSLALGVPAKVIRPLTDAEIKETLDSAAAYRRVGLEYESVFRETK